MLKRLKSKTSLLIGSGLVMIGILGGAIWLVPKAIDNVDRSSQEVPSDKVDVLALAALPPEQRDAPLKALSATPTESLNRSRARYLLAVDLIKRYEGGPALRQLEGLEKDYPVLAPYILLKRGRAYELTNENKKAQETWQKL
ncbi:MAG: tetratricopeptide repeat protein, partial [Microcystaceae cyanobacterium]